MDEETRKVTDSLQAQLQFLLTFYNDLNKRLDAVQDLAVTVSAFARATERVIQDHLTLLAAAAAEAPPATRPRPGPEVG